MVIRGDCESSQAVQRDNELERTVMAVVVVESLSGFGLSELCSGCVFVMMMMVMEVMNGINLMDGLDCTCMACLTASCQVVLVLMVIGCVYS